MELSALLAQAHISAITHHADSELVRIQELVEHKVLVDGRGDLEELFGRMLAADLPPSPKTLDLIGHSTPDKSLLALGDWVIDSSSRTVVAFWRGIADHEVLPRLGIHTVRLLGCQTADTKYGRETICKLSEILGVEVCGTRQLIYSAHYDAHGFKDESQHVLISSGELRLDERETSVAVQVARYPRTLDIDALPASPLDSHRRPWPQRIASSEAARDILRLVRRTAGAEMPGLLASPSCEIAMPSTKPNWYHLAQILLDGEFVRVYPDGSRKAGVVYPVDDARALRALVEQLPTVHTSAT